MPNVKLLNNQNFTALKKFTLLFLTVLMFGEVSIFAQTEGTKQRKPLVRCATMEAIEKRFQADPAFKADYEKRVKQAEDAARNSTSNSTARTSTLPAIVTIPVVVHVVLPNPNIITEEAIDYFFSRLNLDYSGLNPDSTNGAAFYPVRGHSVIRFTRARRDPNGNLTSGVERRVGNVGITGNTYQPIKHASAGGLDPWDVTQYYNVFVGIDGSGQGLLGIAPGIGVGGQTETTTSSTGIDGVCINYIGFSNGCFSDPAYNLARTVVHEIGHNFGLFHTFSGCANGADFAQLTPTGQTLPASLLAAADDTPGLATATTNCPTGTVASGCAGATNPPGKMYQSYMDYTADACYSMFSKGQVARMEYVLENFRPGYLTTLGAIPPASSPALDITPEVVVSPGGSEFNNTSCSIVSYPTPNCAGAFIPKVSITNRGSSTITSVTATVTVNGVTSAPVTVGSLSLLTGRSVTVTFPSQNLVTGVNTIKFTTSAPNGGTDQVTSNDNLSTNVTVASPSTIPLSQNFTATTFPPTNFSLNNPDGATTWVRSASGNGNVGSAYMNNYDYAVSGQIDELKTVPLNVVGTGNTTISFDLAARVYGVGNYDTLQVLFSKDCGATYTSVYKKWGSTGTNALGTVSTARYTTPTAADWRNQSITLTYAQTGPGPIIIAFRNTCNYGNNIFLDNINIVPTVARDLNVTSIVSPAVGPLCTGAITPSITIQNGGTEAITSYTVGYKLDGVALPPVTVSTAVAVGATTTYTFPAINVGGGTHTFVAYTGSPVSASGTGDQLLFNDTLTRTFTIANLTPLPYSEGFEGTWSGTPAAPAGWQNISTNGLVTWAQTTPGKNSKYSAFFDNYNFDVTGAIDLLRLPFFANTNAVAPDSILFSFDVAHKNFTGANDRLRVLASTNCTTSFTSIYSKSGATLATAGASTAEYSTPIASDWRNEKIALAAPYITSPSLIFQFENQNAYGNNIFIDNVNIKALYSRDIELTTVISPDGLICSNLFAPVVKVTNKGRFPITAFTVSYVFDNGTPVTTNFTGVNILRDSSLTVTLTGNTGALTNAQHIFTAYTSGLVTTSGTGDVFNSNDTLRKVISYTGTTAAPLVETFDGTTFPPAGWGVRNPDAGLTWTKASVGRSGTGSAYVNNFNYSTASSTVDELYTPVITYAATGSDSLFLKFDVAASTYSYPGSTAVPLDTLEVLITKDCGKTFTSIYKKWGDALQTIGDPNSPNTGEFIPTSGLWRTDSVNLTSWLTNGPIQFAFRNTSNFENNIYIDNVNVSTKTLSAALKANGYLITPNPVTDVFYVQHAVPPTTLKGIGVYNSLGQRLTYTSYNGNADSYMAFNIARLAPGIYTVKLEYTNKTVASRIVKL